MNKINSVVSRQTLASIGAKSPRTPVICRLSEKPLESGSASALRKSNALFRRSLISDVENSVGGSAPMGSALIDNADHHSKDFVRFVVRSVAYAEDNDNGDPHACGDHGEFFVDGKMIVWRIQLDTPCGTLASMPGVDPIDVKRNLTITLPIS